MIAAALQEPSVPTVRLIDRQANQPSIPVTAAFTETLDDTLARLGPVARRFAQASNFGAAAGKLVLLPGDDGALTGVLFGLGKAGAADADPLQAGSLATGLPPGTYRLHEGFPDPALSALAVALGGYRFARYRAAENGEVRLEIPPEASGADLLALVAAVTLARDLINTPANDMGPAEIAATVRAIAAGFGAVVAEIVGDDLLAAGLPLIHAVGAAATPARAPRLIDMTWGDPAAPRVTLVGKGVAFDTGGLDIKPSDAMLLMKKDMGGAANALALATLVMDAGLGVRLRLLIPAVENAISGAAFRPGDILPSRKGLSVEIGNTDAEGRLILADALTLAGEEQPELLIDFATLTGAARVALGPDVAAIFTRDDALAADLARHAAATADPLWRLPLWAPYASMLESKIADINNAGTAGFAGAITAALFLSRFVGDIPGWIHADLYAWSRAARPGRPEGGDAQTIRALHALLKERYPARA